jgi:uncharacterized phage protein (TIGR02218 family)
VSKTIHATLLAHKEQASTTLCDCLLVGPLPDDTYRGFTSLDTDVDYNPGSGSVTFRSHTGAQLSAMVSTADLGVDNAEAETLIPITGFEVQGFTQTQIDAGALDKVPFVIYRVNYNDLTAGQHEIVGGGTIGEVRTKVGGLAVVELRSLSQQLKQSIVELDSLACRAKFGSQPIGTGGGVVEERFPCGFDASTLWVAGEVESVGTETDREFTDATSLVGTSYGEGYFVPGVVEWLTGENAGQTREVEAYDETTGEVTLQFPTVSAIAVGDTYRIRPDCTHQVEGNNGCRFFWGSDWVNHYRGEPNIPVAEAAKLNTPGAALAGGPTGTGE